MTDGSRRLVLIDGHALLYRAFFGFPKSLVLSDGQLVNAAYGFIRILLSTMTELKPTHLAVSFDVGKTFRHKEFESYKAHREKMPDELRSQEPIVQEILGDLNVPIYSVFGFEADDVIGTLAKQAAIQGIGNRKQGLEGGVDVMIVTGDKDMWQLVNEQIHVYVPGTGIRQSRIVDRQGVKDSLGVWPEQVPDYKGLAGDSSDNIPGVNGIGPKTAASLIEQFGSVEGLYDHVDEVKESVRAKLVRDKQQAIDSKHLATIVTDVPIQLDWDHCKLTTYDKDKAMAVLTKYDFKSLIPKLPRDTFEESVQEALF
jgi:DNA polymerase I